MMSEEKNENVLREEHSGRSAGSWAILELFGHKVVAGYISKDENLGSPMIRIDIPATKHYPEFTRHYNPAAIYSFTYVSKEVAIMTAEQVREDPISVYIPELEDMHQLREENAKLREYLVGYKHLPENIE
jgi:hypothetical protein